jgi:hypothetical protein
VDENKIKKLLQVHAGENSAKIIAGEMIARQVQKIKSRQQVNRDKDIDEADTW